MAPGNSKRRGRAMTRHVYQNRCSIARPDPDNVLCDNGAQNSRNMEAPHVVESDKRLERSETVERLERLERTGPRNPGCSKRFRCEAREKSNERRRIY